MKDPILTKISFLISIVLLVVMTTSTSCNKDKTGDGYVDTPIAGFTWTGNEFPAPVEIQFVNTSLNANYYEWDFGDGGESNDKDPKHTYFNTSGDIKTFQVTLKAIDLNTGLFQRKSKVLQILPGN